MKPSAIRPLNLNNLTAGWVKKGYGRPMLEQCHYRQEEVQVQLRSKIPNIYGFLLGECKVTKDCYQDWSLLYEYR